MSLGLWHAQVTRGLQPTCLWTFPCANAPCLPSAACVEDGFYHFRCVCARANCFRRTTTSTGMGAGAGRVVRVQDVVVREGATVVLTSGHIQLLVNHTAYGVRDSSVTFTVIKRPSHGALAVDVRTSQTPLVFTLMDLKGGRVSYTHDGSELTSDDLNVKLQFVSTDERAPPYLRRSYAFSLRIRVRPWNDPPLIGLLDGGVLHVVANTHVTLTRWIIEATDRDDPPRHLRFTVRYAAGAADVGFIELATPGGVHARVTAFSQQNVNDGRVRYVHRGTRRQSVVLQVSDGKDASEARTLRIVAAPLQIRAVVNTGIELAATSLRLISRANLSYATNAPHQQVALRYDVTAPPYFGAVQRQRRVDNAWVTVTTFTQSDVDESRVRYSHSNPSRINQDYFRFRVGAMGVRTTPAEFVITFHASRVTLVTNASLELRGVREATLTPRHLAARSTVSTHRPRDVVYSILTTPRRGQLTRASSGGRQPLTVGANFTQEDIDAGRVVYRLHKMLYAPERDQFRFRLRAPGNDAPNSHVCDIVFTPAAGGASGLRFVNEGLAGVLEGGTKVLGRQDLYLETTKNPEFRFRVVEPPRHGWLNLLHPGGGPGGLSEANITRFTTADIRAGRVQYQHDDSESAADGFRFVAVPDSSERRPDGDLVSFRATFDIAIALRNDNPPVRVVTRVFDVVANGGRRMTTDDICYVDPDIDFDSSTLIYSRRDIANGQIVRTSNHSVPIYKFTQADLAAGRVYFQQRGPAYAKSVIWVTDGQYYATGLLEVRVTQPYVRVVNNTGLEVKVGGRVVILVANLSVTTNLDTTDADVRFAVIQPPSGGKLTLDGDRTNGFSFADLKRRALAYEHDGESTQLEDRLRVTVSVQSARVEADLTIYVMTEGRRSDTLAMNANGPLRLNERERAIIGEQLLNVSGDSPAALMRYTVTEPPVAGALVLKGERLEGGALRSFTQQDVNRGRLQYRHKNVARDWDSFSFDVTNGNATLRRQTFRIDVVPATIPLRIKRFKLREGDRRGLSDIVSIDSQHFSDRRPLYLLVRPPSHGWLALDHLPRVRITRFRQAQLDDGRVCYVHDGSDVTDDRFSLVVRAAGRHSQPTVAHLAIIAVNDEPPRVVANRPLQVWPGSTTVIDRLHLRAEDADTPPTGLSFLVSNPLNGRLVSVTRPHDNIVNFTQSDVDFRQVAFVHTGKAYAE